MFAVSFIHVSLFRQFPTFVPFTPHQRTAMTKIFLSRIFPVREIRLGAWILGSITAVWGIAIILVCIFQCTPVQKAWAPTVPGTCINLRASFIGNAVPNILTDVAIIVLPVREVWKLQTRRMQKLQLSFIFLLGSL